ncbi:MAG: LamG domain-containing protein, partial [Schleiferiaceae bacterium]|nr:LamG domain-containing protein [Schleiferiaceae bacterium]
MSTKAQTGCEVTSDVNDICIGDEVRLEFSYPPPGNYSVEFDGVNQLIEVPHQAALDFGNTEFSVEFWFNPDNTAGPAIMFSKISATGVGYAIGINAGLLTVTLNDGSGVPVVITGTTPLQTGVWQHCAVTFDRMGDCTLYLDGLIDAIQTIVGVGSIANSDAIGIGGPAVNVGGLANYFAGKIDEARVWSRVIAGTEISANLTLHLNPDNEIGLNGYWDFNEGGVGVGGVARDCGIAMQDGSLLNGTAFSADVKTFTWDFGVTWNTGDVGYVLFKNPEDTTKYGARSG